METRTPTIGVGASAGGIDAIEGLLRHTATDTGLAFVIVTHLSPERESLLPEIIARFTDMPVHSVQDNTAVRPNCVYVLPENAILGLENGVLKLRGLTPGLRERKPIDVFFSALAKDLGEYCGGIVLSGGDGDGTLGVKAIKERGGLTMAQTEDGNGPTHPDMPRSAISTGLVDFAVPATEMGARLADFSKSLYLLDGMADAERDAAPESVGALNAEIYQILRTQSGHDFSGYKPKTFIRRIQRRMQVANLTEIDVYIEKLRQEPAEVTALFRDLLITVTNFFRDADAFQALETLVIPKLFENKGAEDTVRVWAPACATGEEAYSLAILMREHMNTLRGGIPRVQIFATDIEEGALHVARAGRYPDALMDTVSIERRHRFFTEDGGAFVARKEIRDLCIFSPHSVIRDPPFSRMDMVSCRNLLIYFGPDIQKQVIPIFHYSLRPNGYLFLGSSENVSQHADLFSPIDKSQRIFRAREDGRAALKLPMAVASTGRAVTAGPSGFGRGLAVPLRHRVDAQVLERFAPPHMVVNLEGDVVHYSANTGKYVEPAMGAPSRSLLGMARKGLRLELRAALREAVETRKIAIKERVALEADEDRVQFVTISVEPMSDRLSPETLFLVTFVDVGAAVDRSEVDTRAPGQADETVALLDRELRETRDRLQSLIEEYETALEEIKASNEELLSVNEELQSTNEELEASKEELQSLNEELQTVNIELSHKVDALDQSNSDLNNLFSSTQVATIFLDRKLLIRNFTPPIADLFTILPGDKGRPLTDFAGRLNYPDLREHVLRTLATGEPHEENVTTENGRAHYLARLRPYTAVEGDTEGVVLTFVDITSIKETEAQNKVLIAELNHRVKNMLAVVVGVVRQTAKNAGSVTGFTSDLTARLENMSRSYELLSRETWTGASLSELARSSVIALGGGQARVDGPDVAIDPKLTLSLGMVLHELATNALKYGALSNAEGVVDVSWSIEASDSATILILDWEERGGPPASKPPKLGFGLRLVERETAHGMSGAVDVDWRPGGLAIRLRIPMS